jgi:dienelactone hydrolase
MAETIATTRRQFLRLSAGTCVAGWASRLGAEQPPASPTVDEEIKKQAADAPLAMQFPGGTAEDCRKWQDQFAAKLRSLLGAHQPPAKWKTVSLGSADLDDHRREELLLEAEGHPALPVYLLTPRGQQDQVYPGVLAIHGHGRHGFDPVAGRDDLPGVAQSIQGANYDYGRQLARRGYMVAVPCLTPFGRRLGNAEAYGKQDPCAVTFVRLQLLGKVLTAENLRDCLWALELLARHKQCDANHLGCVGLSYGGRMTMLTSALEPRIKVAVVSGALNVMQERVSHRYSCGAQVIPGLLRYGDVPEIASLIAPRPCLWEVGSKDGLISPAWADEALIRIRRAYTAYEAKENLRVDRFDGGHRWNGQVANPLLDKVLKSS